MQFINIFMLAGLAAVAIPIVIQLLSRKNSRRIKWGAWLFLDKTLKKRKRKMLLEDILLLACRCLACGLLALAFARPFVRPDSPVPWAVTLPVFLLAMTAVGVSFALWRYPKQRRLLFWSGIALFALALSTVVFERWLNLRRFGLGATKDVVLIVDGSASMSLKSDGKSNFERAIEESKKYVELAPRNTAFAVIVGGPVPQVMNPVPVADKRVIFNTLERLYPANGTMQIAANLTAAAVTLAAGHNAVKQIVIVGDGQSVGWPLDDKERWRMLKRVFATLRTQPIITWRTLPLPTSIRNLAIASVRPARAVVGTDREVRIDVTVANAGTEAVTPKGVTLEAEGKTYRARGVQQLEPGESRTFAFSHRFAKPGGALLAAKVDCDDDLPNDDTYRFAMPVIDSLKTLIVDGDGGSRFGRAATYVALALRPEIQKAAAAPDAPAAAARYLMETETEDISAALGRSSFGGFSSVVLCGLRRLSPEAEARLADFVRAGGGLLVLPGAAADTAALNAWKGTDGAPLLPAPYAKAHDNDSPLDTTGFTDVLERFRTGTDLGTAVPDRVFGFGEPWASNAVAMAKFGNGEPALLWRTLGRGVVVQSAFNLGPSSSLVAKHGFVPFVHELAHFLAHPSSVTLDVHPSEGLSLLVASGSAGGSATRAEGLVGYYYPERDFKGKPVVRVDPKIEFSWWNAAPLKDFPQDNFCIRWRGAFSVPATGRYKFGWRIDDRMTMRIADQVIRGGAEYDFEAGKSLPIEIKFEEDSGGAVCQIYVECEKAGVKGPLDTRFLATHAAGVMSAGDIVEVTDPHGEVFYSEMVPSDDGLFVRFTRSVVPGVYRVAGIPEQYRDILAGVTGADGKIPVSVSSGVEESTLAAITQEQLSDISSYVQISQALKDEDVVKAIGGQSFGKEVWRMLALFAFLFLVLEPFVARWIAINRRTGDVIDMESSWIRM